MPIWGVCSRNSLLNEDEQKHLLDAITASKTSTEQLAASSTALLAELQTVVGGKD